MAFQRHANEYGDLVSYIPWIRHFFPNMSNFNQMRSGSMIMHEFMKEIISRQTQTYQEGHIRHFMDMYIKEVKDAELRGEDSGFLCKFVVFCEFTWCVNQFFIKFITDDQLLLICVDFLFPSLTAMEIQVSYLIRHLFHRPDILKKIQYEIDNVVGTGRLPELDDRVQ